VLSLVKSNSDADVGFLVNERLMNVAITRAQKGLIIIGNPSTFLEHGVWLRFLQDYNEKNLICRLDMNATDWRLTKVQLSLVRRPTHAVRQIQSKKFSQHQFIIAFKYQLISVTTNPNDNPDGAAYTILMNVQSSLLPLFDDGETAAEIWEQFKVRMLVDPVEAYEDNAARIRLYGDSQNRLDRAVAAVRAEIEDEYRALRGLLYLTKFTECAH